MPYTNGTRLDPSQSPPFRFPSSNSSYLLRLQALTPKDRHNTRASSPSQRINQSLVDTNFLLACSSIYNSVKTFADEFVLYNAKYTPSGGGLAEQYDRSTGTPKSARDLTWLVEMVLPTVTLF